MKLKIIQVSLFVLILLSCSNTDKICVEKIPKKGIIYTEVIEGKYSDNGNIVLYDLETNKKSYITKDYYIDKNADYSSKLNRIVFEAKREWKGGLSPNNYNAPSHIYIYNPEDCTTEKLAERWKDDPLAKDIREESNPIFLNNEGSILFVGYKKYDDHPLYIYDYEKNKLKFLWAKIPDPDRMIISQDNRVVAINYFEYVNDFEPLEDAIILLDIKAKKYIILHKEGQNYSIGGFINNKLIFASEKSGGDKNHLLELLGYNLITKEIKKIYTFKEDHFVNEIFPLNKNEFYYLGSYEGYDEIFHIKLDSNKIEQLTNDKTRKYYLRYFSKNN